MKIEEVRHIQSAIRASAQGVAAGEKLLNRLLQRFLPLEISIGTALTDDENEFRVALRLRGMTSRYAEFSRQVTRLFGDNVDVRTTGPARIIHGCPGKGRGPRELVIGGSIGHYKVRGGTIGFFARRRSDGAVGLVSNNHILAAEDLANDGAKVIHPSRCDGGHALHSTNIVAFLVDKNPAYPRLKPPGAKASDCAFARLVDGRTFDPSTLDAGRSLQPTVRVARNKMRVSKIGRTTGLTHGRVVAADFDDLQVKNYHFLKPVSFVDQIEIETTTNASFSDGGDSGSLVFDEAGRPVGLLFAETASGGANGLGLHYATPIQTVLNVLDVDLLT